MPHKHPEYPSHISSFIRAVCGQIRAVCFINADRVLKIIRMIFGDTSDYVLVKKCAENVISNIPVVESAIAQCIPPESKRPKVSVSGLIIWGM